MQQEKTSEQDTCPSNKQRIPPLLWVFLLAILAMVLFFAVPKIKLPKQALVKRYGVDKKTLNKWIELFCHDLIPDFDAYKRKRTVSLLDYLSLTARLGDPKAHPILTKKEIITRAEGSYYTLRGCVENYTDQYGLPSVEAYLSVKKFPPNVGRKLLENYSEIIGLQYVVNVNTVCKRGYPSVYMLVNVNYLSFTF